MSAITKLEAFNVLLGDLLLQRQEAGCLTQEQESDYVAALDYVWWEMTDDEQEAAEAGS